MSKPAVWQMIKEAIEHFNGMASNSQIREYILGKWKDVNVNTINAQIIVLTVNHPSRVHYPENNKPRSGTSQYDILFRTGRGEVVEYEPKEHGIWEIFKNEYGVLNIRQAIADSEEMETNDEKLDIESFTFPIEANLRDFLIQNLHTFKARKLKLFINSNGREGKEYPTDVGFIDILAVDEDGNFVVFELKLSKGPDKAIGQRLRYMGWVT